MYIETYLYTITNQSANTTNKQKPGRSLCICLWLHLIYHNMAHFILHYSIIYSSTTYYTIPMITFTFSCYSGARPGDLHTYMCVYTYIHVSMYMYIYIYIYTHYAYTQCIHM